MRKAEIALAVALVALSQRVFAQGGSIPMGLAFGMPAPIYVGTSAGFGGVVGSFAGALIGWGVMNARCDDENTGIIGCNEPSRAPLIGMYAGFLPGVIFGATDASGPVGCSRKTGFRHATRGAWLGTAIGYAPVIIYGALGGRHAHAAEAIALAGPAMQVVLTTKHTLRCQLEAPVLRSDSRGGSR